MKETSPSEDSNRPFIGRDRELQVLQAALADASNGVRFVFVAGEPGVGKTQLLRKAGARALKAGWRVLEGHAYDSEGMPPYLPFIELLQDYTRNCPPETLKAQAAEFAREILPLLPELRRIFPDLPPGLPDSDPASDRYRFFEGVVGFTQAIAAATPTGLLLCIEDLHWADDSSLLLLEHLARRPVAAPILVLATYRDTELDASRPLARTLEQLVRQHQSQQIDVTPLAKAEVADVLRQLGQSQPPSMVSDAIFQETEGIPFFVHELFDYLSAEGRLFDHEGAWRNDLHMAEADVPRNIRLVIGRRLEMLSEECRRVLAIASVIGRTFDYETLRSVSGLDEHNLLEALGEAQRRHMLARETHNELSLSHELIRQTLLGSLTQPRRQQLHQQVAETLESLHASDLSPYLAELAAHYCAAPAQQIEKALQFSRRAGQAAMAVFAWDQAMSHFDAALQALDLTRRSDDSLRCDLLLALGEASVAQDRNSRILGEIAPAALALAQALGDRARAFAACRIAMDSSASHQPYWLDTAEQYVGEDAEARITLNHKLSTRWFHEGRFGDNFKLLQDSLTLARKLGKPELILKIAQMLLRSGELASEAERDLLNEVDSIGRGLMGIRDLADLQFMTLMAHLQWGDRSRAEVERQQLTELAQRTRHIQAVANAASADSIFDALDGRLLAVLEPRPSLGTYPRAWLARAAGWLGDTVELDKLLAWSELRASQSSLGVPFVAFILAHLGRQEAAREVLTTLLPVLTARPPVQAPSYWVVTLLLEAAALSGDKTTAGLLLDLNADEERYLAKPLLVLMPRHAGLASALLGRYQNARNYFGRAIEFCERIRYRPELALTRLDLAELIFAHFPRERAEALRHIEQAIPELRVMGMQAAWQRALQLRGGVPTEQQATHLPDGLSPREAEVLRLIAEGKSNQQIAAELAISFNTVQRHVSNILTKTSLANRTQAASYAHRHGLS